MTTKLEIKNALKQLGFGLVKMELDHFHSKTYKGFDGKGIQGVAGGSVGPMTMTDAWKSHCNEREQKVRTALLSLGAKLETFGNGFNATFDLGNGVTRILYFLWNTYPTYAHNHYDPSYKTYWLTYGVKDVRQSFINQLVAQA